jgi:hypothetical protein
LAFPVITRPALENLDSDDGFLELAVLALQVLFDDESEEAGFGRELPSRGLYPGVRDRHGSVSF